MTAMVKNGYYAHTWVCHSVDVRGQSRIRSFPGIIVIAVVDVNIAHIMQESVQSGSRRCVNHINDDETISWKVEVADVERKDCIT